MSISFTLHVPTIACSGCVESLVKAIQAIDPSATVAGDAEQKTLAIISQQPEATIREAVINAGHELA